MKRTHVSLSLVVAALGLALLRCGNDDDAGPGGSGASGVAGSAGSSAAGGKAGAGGDGGVSGEEEGGAGTAGAGEGGAGEAGAAGESGAAGIGDGGATGGGGGTAGTSGGGTSGTSGTGGTSGTSGTGGTAGTSGTGGTSGTSGSGGTSGGAGIGGTSAGTSGVGGASGIGTFADVRAIFNANCGNCHGPTNNRVVLVDATLSDAALRSTLVNPLVAPLPSCVGAVLVTPGDASTAASKLIEKLTLDAPLCGGTTPTSRMPRIPGIGACTTAAGNCLSDLDIGKITSWINAGASL